MPQTKNGNNWTCSFEEQVVKKKLTHDARCATAVKTDSNRSPFTQVTSKIERKEKNAFTLSRKKMFLGFIMQI